MCEQDKKGYDLAVTECSYTSHRKCLGYVTRPCLTKVLKVVDIDLVNCFSVNHSDQFLLQDSPNYCMDVCPERGLTQQHFRCGSCNRAFNQHPTTEVRLCDYTGLYHCSRCHSNELAVVPARVLRNWDFAMRRVSTLKVTPLIIIMLYQHKIYCTSIGMYQFFCSPVFFPTHTDLLQLF